MNNTTWSGGPPPPGQMPPQQTPDPAPQYGQGPSGYNIQQFKVLEDSIRAAQTNQVLYEISRLETKHRFSLSEKPAIEIRRSKTEPPLGTVRAHRTSQDVDLTIHGRATTIKLEPLMEEKWCYTSVSGPSTTFWWSEGNGLGADEDDGLDLNEEDHLGLDDEVGLGLDDKDDGLGLDDGDGESDTLTLKDAKKGGRFIAQMKHDILTIQTPGLGQAMTDEIMISAVGMREAIKLKRKQEKAALKLIVKAAGLG
ncbi:hypothetical protein M409DRAFT_19256 [Zasmidium cellare ATCC 36951]|uniref:Uncharacterized protein n=1 Tax=Zasmidium cellare ATCC 36951 TaxID=1080233 RepID=A0A6A6CTQ8_ZASCE|nr:uncharacterized protein M409DRAFT_19256 [Zasmidium cellare ATCC 36951]KAF2170435.1 hypothetical protein M409DRAFT_19256 [Zasmidium cellare ATCC 36951]